jgi:hypothetical protein
MSAEAVCVVGCGLSSAGAGVGLAGAAALGGTGLLSEVVDEVLEVVLVELAAAR